MRTTKNHENRHLRLLEHFSIQNCHSPRVIFSGPTFLGKFLKKWSIYKSGSQIALFEGRNILSIYHFRCHFRGVHPSPLHRIGALAVDWLGHSQPLGETLTQILVGVLFRRGTPLRPGFVSKSAASKHTSGRLFEQARVSVDARRNVARRNVAQDRRAAKRRAAKTSRGVMSRGEMTHNRNIGVIKSTFLE